MSPRRTFASRIGDPRPRVRAVAAVAMLAWVALPAFGASAQTSDREHSACAPFDHAHSQWTSLLSAWVHDGAVDYAGWHRDGRDELAAYLSSLQSTCRADYDTWSGEQKLAYWINAYNAWTVQLVLEHYPLDSIRDIGLLPFSAFRDEFIHLESLRGEALSLNDIEHEILRGEFQEPRIHFAIVCASRSCPVLREEAYQAATLDPQLDDSARRFVRDGFRNHWDAVTGTLHLSSIFDWFGEDFERDGSTVQSFFARYADPGVATALSAGPVRIEWIDYDWALNGQ